MVGARPQRANVRISTLVRMLCTRIKVISTSTTGHRGLRTLETLVQQQQQTNIPSLEVPMMPKGTNKAFQIDSIGLYWSVSLLFLSYHLSICHGQLDCWAALKLSTHTRCSRTARLALLAEWCRADWLGTRKRGPADPLQGSDRPSLVSAGSDLAQTLVHFGQRTGVASSRTERQRRGKNRGGRSRSGAGERSEARRGRQEQGGSRIRLDHPSVLFPPSPVSHFCPSVLVRPQPLCLGRPVIQRSGERLT